MQVAQRHQCLIYQGSPSVQLTALAVAAREKLQANYRCLYLNSPAMVAGMRSYMAAAGVDVAGEVSKGNLFLSSERHQVAMGRFDVTGMLARLKELITETLKDGYTGLWATGDMTWELGPGEMNFSELLDYEWRLEQLFQEQPAFCGICQYHRDTLPTVAMRHALVSHRSLFVNETLNHMNPYFVSPKDYLDRAATYPEMEAAIERICTHHKI